MTEPRSPRRILGYLSGAPRVSTRPEATAGGPRTHVLGVVRAFETLGWEVRPFIAGDRGLALASSAGEERLTGGWAKRAALDLGRLAYGGVNRGRARAAVGRDVTWVYERFASFQALGRAFRRNGVPWILETQGPFWHEAVRERRSMALTGLARRIETGAYQECDVLVCVSETLRDIMESEAGVDPEKVIVVPNGVDLSRFDPAGTQPIRTFGGPTIVFVGALIGWQRLELLIDALAELRDASGSPPFELVIVGDGPERARLEARIAEHRMEAHARMLGRVPMDEVPRHLMGAELGFIAYAGHEHLGPYCSPLKLYEYLAMSLPVLAARIPETEALVREGGTGFLFRANDREDLKSALLAAHGRREDLAALGAAGRQAVEAHSWTSRVADMIARIEEVLGRRRPRAAAFE